MSIEISVDVWKYSTAKAEALLVLLVLADSADEDREVWPVLSSVAKQCRVSEARARQLLEELEDMREIESFRAPYPGSDPNWSDEAYRIRRYPQAERERERARHWRESQRPRPGGDVKNPERQKAIRERREQQ